MTKQVIRHSLPLLAERDRKVEQGIEAFVAKQLRGDEDGDGVAPSAGKFLARILVAQSHRKQVIAEYVGQLAGGSLQSAEELMKVSFALGLDPSACSIDPKRFKPIFDIRNKIIHELDINFEAPRRRRHSRSRDAMVEHANALLLAGENVLLAVAAKLKL